MVSVFPPQLKMASPVSEQALTLHSESEQLTIPIESVVSVPFEQSRFATARSSVVVKPSIRNSLLAYTMLTENQIENIIKIMDCIDFMKLPFVGYLLFQAGSHTDFMAKRRKYTGLINVLLNDSRLFVSADYSAQI